MTQDAKPPTAAEIDALRACLSRTCSCPGALCLVPSRVRLLATIDQQAAEIERLRALIPQHAMFLTDTCYGMTGGDLYVCGTCGSQVVISRTAATTPTCPGVKPQA